MNEKRSFRRRDAESAPGTLVIDGRRLPVVFDNLSLIGARVRSSETHLPPIGSFGTLSMEDPECRFYVRCKVVGLESGEFYRLKFDGIGEGSLNNLIAMMRKLSDGNYDPEEELPNLVLDLG